MTLRHFEYFLVIAEKKNITEAAAALHISQPALSNIVQKMETEMETPLFERGARELSLTPAGECLLEASRDIRTAQIDLERRIAGIKNEKSGRICIGATNQIGILIFPYVLPEFEKAYPGVKLTMISANSDEMPDLLLNRKMDMALLSSRVQRKDLDYAKITELRMVLIAGNNTDFVRRHPRGTIANLSEAGKEKFIELQPGQSTYNMQTHLLTAAGISPEVVFQTRSVQLAEMMTAALPALMLCPESYVLHDPEFLKKVTIYHLPKDTSRYTIYLCTRKDFYMTEYMRFLKQRIIEIFAASRSIAG